MISDIADSDTAHVVYQHAANGLLATPEYGYHNIKEGMLDTIKDSWGMPVGIKDGIVYDGMLYKEWGDTTIVDTEVKNFFNFKLKLNVNGIQYPIKINPAVWEHRLEINWGEGSGESRTYKFDKTSGAYPT